MGEILVSTQEPLLLIESSSFLQVTRTTIEAWRSLNFGGILPLTLELAALERLKKSNYKLVSTLAPSFFILAGNNDNYIVSNEFEIRSDPTMDSRVSCP